MTLEQQPPPPPPPQQQQQPLLLIVVTVGSTRFRSLSQTVISHELTKTLLQQQQHTLARIQVLIQVGNQELRKEGLLSQINAETIRQFNQDCPSISHLSLKPTPNIEFIIFKYSDSIDRLISQAYLVITHAG
jgi:UDP-N-acetylglucosamine transferase subunit ALG13